MDEVGWEQAREIKYSASARAILNDLLVRVDRFVIKDDVGRQRVQMEPFRGVLKEVFQDITKSWQSAQSTKRKRIVSDRPRRDQQVVSYAEPDTKEFEGEFRERLTAQCLIGSNAFWNAITLQRAGEESAGPIQVVGPDSDLAIVYRLDAEWVYAEVNGGRCSSSKLTFFIWYLRLNTDLSIQWGSFSSVADEEKQLIGEGGRIERIARAIPAIAYKSCGLWVPEVFRDAEAEEAVDTKQGGQAAEGSLHASHQRHGAVGR